MLAQRGSRILLVGVKKKIAVFVPKAIKQSWSDAETSLESILNLNLPVFDRAQLKPVSYTHLTLPTNREV